MLVKCWDLNAKLPKEACYKAPNRKYYSSEEAYLETVYKQSLVKCDDTHDKRPKDECFKAPNRKYYSCRAAYDRMVEQTKFRNQCTDLMQDIMGYDHDMKLPTSWYKFLNEFTKYGYDVILETIKANEKTFLWALKTKNFKNDTHALSYFRAIIQNNAMEHYKLKIAREKAALQDKINEFADAHAPSYLNGVGQEAVKGKNLSGLIGEIF